MQDLTGEGVDGDIHRLAGFDPRELDLLVIGDDIDVRQRHHVEQIAADIDVVTRLHLPRADHAIERRDDAGIAQPEFGGLQRRFCCQHIRSALFLGAVEHLELVFLRGDQGAGGKHVGVCLGQTCNSLLEPLQGTDWVWVSDCWRSFSCCASTSTACADVN